MNFLLSKPRVILRKGDWPCLLLLQFSEVNRKGREKADVRCERPEQI
jgi:hypothetical protein